VDGLTPDIVTFSFFFGKTIAISGPKEIKIKKEKMDEI
jgi:hypothetical protein